MLSIRHAALALAAGFVLTTAACSFVDNPVAAQQGGLTVVEKKAPAMPRLLHVYSECRGA